MADYLYTFIGGPMEGRKAPFPMPIEEAPERLNLAFNADGSPYSGKGQPASTACYHKESRDDTWVYVYDSVASPTSEEFFSTLNEAKFTSQLNEYTSQQLINNLVHRPNVDCIVIEAKGNSVTLGLNQQMARHRIIAMLKGALRAIQGS